MGVGKNRRERMKQIFTKGSKQTMTVAELKQYLGNYPDDMPVVATWEGQISGFYPEMFSQEEVPGHYTEKLLMIDVDIGVIPVSDR